MEKKNYYDPEYVAQRQAEYAAKVAQGEKGKVFAQKAGAAVAAFFFKKAVAV